jgi:hypothetical protein
VFTYDVALDGVIQNPQHWPASGGFSDDGGRIQFELLERCDIYSNPWHQQTQHVTAFPMRGDGRPFGGKVHVS